MKQIVKKAKRKAKKITAKIRAYPRAIKKKKAKIKKVKDLNDSLKKISANFAKKISK